MDPYKSLLLEIRHMQQYVKLPIHQSTAIVLSNDAYQDIKTKVLCRGEQDFKFAIHFDNSEFLSFQGIFDESPDLCRRVDNIYRAHPELEFYQVHRALSMYLLVAIASFDSYHYWSPLLIDPEMQGFKAKVMICYHADLYE